MWNLSLCTMTISIQVTQLKIPDTLMPMEPLSSDISTPQLWYPFGYSKAYSTFEYSSIPLDKANTTVKVTLMASVDVTNTSPVDGTEVVQLYIVDTITSVDAPNRKLKAFKKLYIKAGETATVRLPVSIQEIGLE
ncbi:hypothetical protein N7497_005021 [Penicillium chrysogenum]|nr:hypothetical protein N7497_005021 [Penicillium chrysogenum]